MKCRVFVLLYCMSIGAMEKELAVEKLLSSDLVCKVYSNQIIALPIDQYTKSSEEIVIIPINLVHKASGLAVINSKLIVHQVHRNKLEIYVQYCLSNGTPIRANQGDLIKLEDGYRLAISIDKITVADFPNALIYSPEEFVEYLQSL